MTRPTTVIIGGGIAGLAAAWSLARSGAGRTITVLEREALTFSHSSARNAAIYRPLEIAVSTTELANRSRQLLRVLGRGAALVDERGLMLTASNDVSLDSLRRTAARLNVEHVNLGRGELEARCELLAHGHSERALLLPGGGVLDIHAVGERLRRESMALGVAIRTGATAREVLTGAGRVVRGVALDDGTQLRASEVVLAAGAWSGGLGESCGGSLRLVPHRRHLAQLQAEPTATNVSHPVTWNVETGVYFRREGDGYLACPGDHEPHEPCLPPVDHEKVELLAHRLPSLAPGLAGARLRRAWACLRTMTEDGEAAVGRDERVPGLFWLTGLGGFGMSGGLAAGEVLSNSVLGRFDSLSPALSPSRLLDDRRVATAAVSTSAS